MTNTQGDRGPLLQGVDQPGRTGSESGPDRDVGGEHGRDKGPEAPAENRDVGGVHGRDAGEESTPERDVGGQHGQDQGGAADPNRDVGGVHGRDQGQH